MKTKPIVLLIGCIIYLCPVQAQDKDVAAIQAVFAAQLKAWNAGDIPTFMEGYWKSDSLKFIGSGGINYGWENTLKNYQKNYANTDLMGVLSFDILTIEKLSSKAAFVIGKWHIQRKSEAIGGHFTLLWKKIRGKWLIVADHSS
ncbi:MAG: DUF4440 domain-containing protein [Microscillaceae bacterium]|nr:DUF4440 domain-containing protein [Microscillaceae bacterium]